MKNGEWIELGQRARVYVHIYDAPGLKIHGRVSPTLVTWSENYGRQTVGLGVMDPAEWPACLEELKKKYANPEPVPETPEQIQARLEAEAIKLEAKAAADAKYADWVARSHDARKDPEWLRQREIAERKTDEARVNGYVYDQSRYNRRR